MPQAWQFLISPLKSHWQALRAAREKTAQRAANSDPSSVLVQLYAATLTHFSTKY
jgi:hypothetical protein